MWEMKDWNKYFKKLYEDKYSSNKDHDKKDDCK